MGDTNTTGLHAVPQPLDVELPRLRFVDRQRTRWSRPVTLVVAGAGFGKTTAIIDALALRSDTAPGARDVVAALRQRAPLDVCVHLDDVHEIPDDSPGAMMLGAVVRALPDTAHLVLSGRGVPTFRWPGGRRLGR
ncbi:hypothetical protein BBK82_45840 [Lentzea guizhouensis]|uniref:Uncharacterized protein n=1 Tax=Lentzea guizhouensis TaxID=1586287 RepID=A0A1B2HWW7_9PSEU|nr:hypothetical protein [Lentzea guizhouensis]ANZ42175.1 hypothetical protein BBK82_45840 [Lentzea guizhouensis]